MVREENDKSKWREEGKEMGREGASEISPCSVAWCQWLWSKIKHTVTVVLFSRSSGRRDKQRTHQVRGPSSLTMPPTAYGSVEQSYTFSSLFHLLTHSSGGVVAFPLLNTHVIWVYCILSSLERRMPDLLSGKEIEGGYVSHLMARNQGPTSETQGSSPTPKLPSREH